MICRYVCETAANRILRFYQKPTGIYHSSVFYQCSGGVGPVALLYHKQQNVLFVGHYELAGMHLNQHKIIKSLYVNIDEGRNIRGRISSLSIEGRLLNEYTIPAPQITGLALRYCHICIFFAFLFIFYL